MLALHCMECCSLKNWHNLVIASDLFREHILNPGRDPRLEGHFLDLLTIVTALVSLLLKLHLSVIQVNPHLEWALDKRK